MVAAKKSPVVTTDDIKGEPDVKTVGVKYVTVKAPFTGTETSVPSDIVDALIDSGYTK